MSKETKEKKESQGDVMAKEMVQEMITTMSSSMLIMSPQKETKREKKVMTTFAWGISQHGQLGMNPYSESCVVNMIECAKMGMWPTESGLREDIMNVERPSSTWFPKTVENITSISTSYYHTLCADEEGRCYAWGAPFLLGWETRNNQKIPRPIPLPQHIKIVQVAAGKYHSLARDSEGNVYSWGSTDDGRLGCATWKKMRKTRFCPLKVKFDIKISHVAIGECTSFAIGEERGEVYCWGKNKSGVFGPTNEFKKDEIVYTPRLSNAFQKFHVKTLSCPFDHGVALTEDKDVITWGSNQELLGRSSKTYVDTIPACAVDLNEMGNMDIGYVSVRAGRSHSVVLDSLGRLYVWGITKESYQRTIAAQSPDFKKDCISTPLDIKSFVIIDGNKKGMTKRVEFKSGHPATRIERIAAFSFHTIAVSKDQRIYTWGVDKVNRLGRDTGGDSKAYIPTQIPLISNLLPFDGYKFQWEINDSKDNDDGNVFGDDDDDDDDSNGNAAKKTVRVIEVDAGEAQSFVVLNQHHDDEFVDDSDKIDDDNIPAIDIDEKIDEVGDDDEDEKKEDDGDNSNDVKSSGGCCKKCCCVVS